MLWPAAYRELTSKYTRALRPDWKCGGWSATLLMVTVSWVPWSLFWFSVAFA